MSTQGHASRVIGQLLGYLDLTRPGPAAPAVLATRGGAYLHVMGHSFGCRFVCEAVQWAADDAPTLGWSTPRPPGRPFTVDSMLLLQMAAPRDAFATTFPSLGTAPLRGPVVATYSQHDRANLLASAGGKTRGHRLRGYRDRTRTRIGHPYACRRHGIPHR